MGRRSWLVGVFALLAFAQTMAYYVYLRDDPGNYNGAGAQGDQVAYIDLAQQVLHGTWQGAVHYMPGLPAIIALGQIVTGDPRLGIALIQGLVYAACVILAARLAADAFGERTQTCAAALVGLNPALGYYAAQALTEFLTGAVLLGLAIAAFHGGRHRRVWNIGVMGLLIGAAAYLRSEYLGLAVVFVLITLWVVRRRPLQAIVNAAVLVGVTALTMAPWVVRYAVTTGTPALYNESPFSNLVLMGTWFRVFDEQTFSELQQIETAPGTRDQAIERAKSVGPRPELSQRYMEQSRGPYERPLPETLSLAADNIRLNLRQYLVNHVVLAPVLVWAGHTPLRQADAPRLPPTARYTIWGAELALLLLALWQAAWTLVDAARPLAALGPWRRPSADRDKPNAPAADRQEALGPTGVDRQEAPATDAELSAPSDPPGQGKIPLRVAARPLAPWRSRSTLDEDVAADEAARQGRIALALSFVGIVIFLTAVHVLIAVDERFTTPALPLIGLFAGARVAELVGRRRAVAVRYAA